MMYSTLMHYIIIAIPLFEHFNNHTSFMNTNLFLSNSVTDEPGTSDASTKKSPYGLHPMYLGHPVAGPSNVPRPFTPIRERKTNQEATILGFIAEENLPFAIAPKLVTLSQELGRDKKALDALSLSRTAASYKMQHGLSKTFHDEIISILKQTPFSLNIDEATSNNKMRVLSVLVSFYNPKQQEVITQHLKSISLIHVNAESLYNAIVEMFEEYDLPWTNLMSILMDSCAVMRGSKSGLETRIREKKAPHLLDVDGDSCHHAHNASKKLCAPFGYHIEGLIKDIHSDFMWSADLREALQEICEILNIKYAQPRNYIAHRWLSVYDTGSDLSRLLPALTLFYYAFVDEQDRKLYRPIVTKIYEQFHLSKEACHRVIQIRKRCTAKSGMTKEGKDRKKRVVEKLFVCRRKTRLHLSYYLSVLPLLQRYVKTFEMTEPLIYKLNDYQVELLNDIMVCFVRPEVMSQTLDLGALDVTNKQNLLPKKKMFVGKEAKDVMTGCDDPVTGNFLDTVQQAYIQCTQQLQKKMPLDNQFLMCVSAIDPAEHVRGHSETLHNLLKLPSLAKHVLSDVEQDLYDLECRRYVSKTGLPPFSNRADTWWAQMSGKFPVLTKMALSLLSCFHGPQVESSFSAMNQIIDAHSANLSIHSFQAYQTVRYHLKSVKKSAVEYFHKEDYKHDPTDPHLCKNFTHAWQKQKEAQDSMKAKREEKRALLNLKTAKKQTSKRKFREESEAAAKHSRAAHTQKLMNPGKKRHL